MNFYSLKSSHSKGIIRDINPFSRFICWFGILIIIIAAPATSIKGMLTIIFLTLFFIYFFRPPNIKVIFLICFFSFLPVFFLLPWTGSVEEVNIFLIKKDAWKAPFNLFLKGSSCMFLGLGLISSFDMIEHQKILSKLPLPKIIKTIIFQILNWLVVLISQAMQINLAVKLRSNNSFKEKLGFIINIPKVWIPRIFSKAQRLTDAMLIREYDGQYIKFKNEIWTKKDYIAISLVLLLITISYGIFFKI